MYARTAVPKQLCQVALVAALIMAAVGLSCAAGEEIPPLERRAQKINGAVMCPVCPGESIDQSQHPLAAQMRNIVAERLEMGWTEKQIKAYFVEAYGPAVLLQPPTLGSNLLVWLVPPLGIALALVALIIVLRQMRTQPPQSVEAPLRSHLSEGESEEYLDRAQAALAYEGLDALQDNPDAPSGAGPRGEEPT